jgi:hypothetical protein
MIAYMKRIFSTPDRAMAGMVQALLEDNRIRTWLKNEFIAGGVGDIPPQECWQEIWVLDERDETPALRLLQSLAPQATANNAAWQCQQCGEWLEPAFSSCWRCAGNDSRTLRK